MTKVSIYMYTNMGNQDSTKGSLNYMYITLQ